jgi:hypothetical protein
MHKDKHGMKHLIAVVVMLRFAADRADVAVGRFDRLGRFFGFGLELGIFLCRGVKRALVFNKRFLRVGQGVRRLFTRDLISKEYLNLTSPIDRRVSNPI